MFQRDIVVNRRGNNLDIRQKKIREHTFPFTNWKHVKIEKRLFILFINEKVAVTIKLFRYPVG